MINKKTVGIFFFAILIIFMMAELASATWWDNTWQRRQEINITNAGSSNLVNFPALVNISYDLDMQADYDDIRFINGSCSSGQSLELPYEIENYTGNYVMVWVSIPLIPASGVSSICMYYKNTGASNGQNSTGLWKDYSMVYHFNEPSGTTGANSVRDSTGNTNGTPTTGISFGQTGILGSSPNFSAGTGISLGNIGSSILTNETTISFWLYSDNYASPSRQNPFNQAYGGWSTMTVEPAGTISWYFGSNGGDSSPYGGYSTGSVMANGKWIYITAVRNPADYTYKWYKNGTYNAGSTYPNTYPTILSRTFTIGDGYVSPFNGKIDEFRVSTLARSADWINQEYQLIMNQGSYITFGIEENADITPPLVNLVFPEDQYNTSSRSLNFTFRGIENYAGDINCSIYIDSSYITSNSTVKNNTLTNLSASNITGGLHYWYVLCKDLVGNQNTSLTKSFYVDLYPPVASDIVYYPNSTDDVDPEKNIAINVTLTDGRVFISRVILQYFNGSSWANKTMSNNSATNWNATFTTLSIETNYTFNIWSNDTFGNSGSSSNRTFSSAWDCTWTATPDLVAVAGWDENKFIGNIAINNTGDAAYSNNNCSLSFHLIHDLTTGRVYFDNWANNRWYNYYDVLSLGAKSNSTVKINATFLSEVKEEPFKFSISESSGVSSITSRNTTATLISTTGGPYLYKSIVSIPSSLYLTHNNFSLSAYIRNLVGDDTSVNTAYNVSFNWSLPSGFSVKDGNATLFYENLSDNNLNYNDLNITFNSTNLPTLSPGTYNLTIYTYGYNSTGVIITHAGNLTIISQSAAISLSCYNVSDGVYVTSCGSLDGDYVAPVTTPAAASSSSGSGGGGGGSGGKSAVSEENFQLVRGKSQEFDLEIKNKFSSTLKDLKISVSGIKSEYISLEPDKIDLINPLSSVKVKVKIATPAYLTGKNYRLVFEIKGKYLNNISYEDYTERKTVTLYVVEISKEEAALFVNNSVKFIEEMNASGMIITQAVKLLEQIKVSFKKVAYSELKTDYDILKQLRDSAFESKSSIIQLKESIIQSEKAGISVLETKKLLYLAETAYTRGDYILALERVKEAKLSYSLETKGEFNLIYTVKNHPIESLGILLIIAVTSTGTTLGIKYRLSKRKLKLLGEEERLILELMKVVQKECFENVRMSMEEYGEAMSQYENRLSEVIEDKIRTETKLSHTFKFKGKKRAMEEEKRKLTELIKDLQDRYLNKGQVETRIYNNMIKSYSSRLGDIEEQITFIEAQDVLGKKRFKLFGLIR